ncbi:hypothetical protein KAT24_01790 [Candidatus Pacearchaeota archaeon]|nr:hypothetical protein [Candidatus Pacearchaeota archaeon]
MAKNIEDEVLSYEEFVDLAARAESLRQYDEKKQSLLALPDRDHKGITVKEWLKEAESIGIDKEYMLKAINTRMPSIVDQLREIKEHNGIPSISSIFETYYNTLEKKLEETLPSKFRIGGFFLTIEFWKIIETEEVEKKGLIFKKEIKKKINKKTSFGKLHLLSNANYDNVPKFVVSLDLTDPLFLHIFGEDIKKLNSYFKKRGFLNSYKVRYDYKDNIDEASLRCRNKINN